MLSQRCFSALCLRLPVSRMPFRFLSQLLLSSEAVTRMLFSFLFEHLCCDNKQTGSEQKQTIALAKFIPICMLVLDHVVSCNNRCLVSSVVSNYAGLFSFLFRHLCCDTGSPSEQNKTILLTKFMPICMLVLDHVVPCNNICLVCSVVSNYLGFCSFFFRHLYCDTGSPSEQNKTSLPAK